MIGEDTREQLGYVPASLIALEHVRPKYAYACSRVRVVIAPRLPEPIEKGLLGDGLLAHVAVSKVSDHPPLDRLEGIFRRHGVELARSTMCDWMATVADLLGPIVRELTRRVPGSAVVGTDDTPVKVQDHGGKGVRTGYLWARVRRKSHECRASDPGRSHAAIARIGRLHAVEREAREGSWDDDSLMAVRRELSRPILDQFQGWLEGESKKVLPRMGLVSTLGMVGWIRPMGRV